jgi:hypothetical protein
MNKQNEALEYVIEALQSYKRGYPDTAADRLVSAFNASEQAVELRLVDATIEALQLRKDVNENIAERNRISLSFAW